MNMKFNVIADGTERHLLNIGFIPTDCKEMYITCGDPDSFGGKDISVYVSEVSGEDDIVECKGSRTIIKADRFFDDNSPMWISVIKEFIHPLLGSEIYLEAKDLHNAWALFMGELEKLPDNFAYVLGKNDGDVFRNEGEKYNGKVYIYYLLSVYDNEEWEYSEEKVVVIL